MILQIDHIILAVDRDYYPALSEQLKAAGFVHADAGKHAGGTQNENVAFAGGAFLELLHEQSPGSGQPSGSARPRECRALAFLQMITSMTLPHG